MRTVGAFADGLLPEIADIEAALSALRGGLKEKRDVRFDSLLDRLAELRERLSILGGHAPVAVAPFELNDFVKAFQASLTPRLPESVVVTLALTANMGRVVADPAVVERVLFLLVDNALEAMPKGGALTIRTLRGPEPRRGEDPLSVISVTDTGHGMPPEVVERALEPFFTTKTEVPGAGLGLATAYAWVARLGGRLGIESEVDRGTTVTVVLTRERTSGRTGHDRVVAPSAKSGDVVLVVEDEESVRRAIVRILRADGYTVMDAAGGRAALELLASSSQDVDLLLTDAHMSDMTGPDLARRVSEKVGPLRVLYMTGYVGDLETTHGLSDVGTALLKKPFTPDVLLTRVREALGARARYAIQVV
ncbi:MAG: response regulator [Deltaproteobacteria bacterium]|nr:response regulator [Deltaproteobacteria bacterium]